MLIVLTDCITRDSLHIQIIYNIQYLLLSLHFSPNNSITKVWLSGSEFKNLFLTRAKEDIRIRLCFVFFSCSFLATKHGITRKDIKIAYSQVLETIQLVQRPQNDTGYSVVKRDLTSEVLEARRVPVGFCQRYCCFAAIFKFTKTQT
jgi:hypothetical protein